MGEMSKQKHPNLKRMDRHDSEAPFFLARRRACGDCLRIATDCSIKMSGVGFQSSVCFAEIPGAPSHHPRATDMHSYNWYPSLCLHAMCLHLIASNWCH